MLGEPSPAPLLEQRAAVLEHRLGEPGLATQIALLLRISKNPYKLRLVREFNSNFKQFSLKSF